MQTYSELLHSLAHGPELLGQQFLGPASVVARSTRDVLEAARRRGSQLAALGVRRGERVGLIVKDPAEFLPLLHACLLYGFVAVPLSPPPLFGDIAAYGLGLDRMLVSAEVGCLVVSDALAPRLGPQPQTRVMPLGALPTAPLVVPGETDPSELAILQFTSGSTAAPRAVAISHAALMANARAIMVEGLAAGVADHGVSWLPLYHDMGLIGFGLAPLLTRTPVSFLPTERFIKRPGLWLRSIAELRATITFAPNFAYALVTRRTTADELDLSCVRMWGCGAEPISESTLAAFEQRFAGSGVLAGQVSPCYGLAEATLAVTFTGPSRGRAVDDIDAQAWEECGEARPAAGGARRHRYVCCGAPLPGFEVSIVDTGGQVLPERRAGEIVVTGPSLGEGYFGAPEESARVFQPQGLHTGDRGYLANGQLYVAGRLKDTVIVNGRNYDPRCIEHAAEQVSGVRAAVAVSLERARVPGEAGDEVAVIVELATARSRGPDADERIAEAVRASVAASEGVSVSRVACVAAGRLPRTTSGKLRRGAARALLGE